MGLLEKALEYKKEINRKGKTTLIDKIKGPAETEMPAVGTDNDIFEDNGLMEDIAQDLNDDLFELPKDDNYSPIETLKEQKNEQAAPKFDETLVKDGIKIKPAVKVSSQKDDDPLSREDEPELPKDIDKASENLKDMNMRKESNHGHGTAFDSELEIPEIEPYIISDNDDFNKSADADLPESPAPEMEIDKNKGRENYDFEKLNIPDKIYQKHLTLYEITKEISRSETKKALFEVVIFSIMGQIGTSSAFIMIRNPENDRWIIVNSSGLKSAEKNFSLSINSAILKSVKKDIIDIEKFRDEEDCRESYHELASTGARVLSPWYFKGKVLGILAIGNKITEDDFTDDEKDFIQAISEASAIELNKISTFEKLKAENENLKTDFDFFKRVDDIQEEIITKNTLKEISDIAESKFNELGIIDYSVYIKNEINDNFFPVITGKHADYKIEFKEDKKDFISFVASRKAIHRIEDFKTIEIIKSSLNEAAVEKMSVFWVYPLEIAGHLIGFTLIFNVKNELLNQDRKNEIDDNLGRFSKRLLSAAMNIMQFDPDENRYKDSIEKLFRRIDTELENSKRLSIPLSLIIFSIKNFKRYGSLFGYIKSKELINNFRGLIKNRLSETDFAARYDRNKILVVLPGKDKKFASALANTVRAEFIRSFRKDEMQILITFLISAFPEDGGDILPLIDNID